ncbi:hypothetical protein [Streptomyces misionensis]|uniref:hypothetical protein n=1 Tax=Streptomyces misionensis TaxID=67331 RepID=UPI0033FEA38E
MRLHRLLPSDVTGRLNTIADQLPLPALAERSPRGVPLRDPDFELYDNVGRDADQIAAARYGTATRSDLLRWAKRDAKPFLADHPLPDQPLPAPDVDPYLTALAAAKTPAEVSAVTQHLLDAAQPALGAVSEVLVAIARWGGRNRSAEPGSPPKMLMSAASHVLAPLNLADLADLTVLRAEYDPAPRPPAPPRIGRRPVLPRYRPARPARSAPADPKPPPGGGTPCQPAPS